MAELPEVSAEVIALLVFLLPGFVVAWVFYGLTSHPRPERFERTVQALIFTFVAQALVPVFRWVLLCAGSFVSLGVWDAGAQVFWSLISAALLGLLLSICSFKDWPHRWLRALGFTIRTAHPSEWFYTFSRVIKPVVLQLKDGRRVQGWPKEWPVDPARGQFYLEDPAWITDDGEYIPELDLDGILIQAADAVWVEFQKDEGGQNDKRDQTQEKRRAKERIEGVQSEQSTPAGPHKRRDAPSGSEGAAAETQGMSLRGQSD